jgi:hypothetical protein
LVPPIARIAEVARRIEATARHEEIDPQDNSSSDDDDDPAIDNQNLSNLNPPRAQLLVRIWHGVRMLGRSDTYGVLQSAINFLE